MRKNTKVMDEARVKEIFALKEKGLTYRQIVREMKTSSVSVAKYGEMGLENALEFVRAKREALKNAPAMLSKEAITSDEKASLWVDSMDKGSFTSYVTGLGYFCALVSKKPTELIEEAISEIKGGKLLSERGYFTFLLRFEAMLKKEGYADTTRSGYTTAVRSFYGFYDIQMPKKKGGRKDKKIRPLRENRRVEITKEDLQNMLNVSKYLRDMSLILAVASSGLGRAELRLLDVGDFVNGYDEETGICMLKDVWRVKTGNDFISCLSSECSAMVWQYLQSERGISKEEIKLHFKEPLFTATKDTWKGAKGLVSRLAPVSIDQIFRNIAIRVDVKNGPRETANGNTIFNRFHPHNIRKFFNSKMINAGCPEITVEFLMGHEIEPTKATYYITNPTELEEIYLKYMPAVTIQPTETHVIESSDYKELKEENKKLKEAIDALKAREEKTSKLDKRYANVLNNPKVQQVLIEAMKEMKLEDE